MDHEDWMRLALKLARKGWGKTNPNPCVGCVIVRKNKVLGQGWHKKAGEAHAEVLAIRDAEKRHGSLNGATLYVTLEPCCTHGRTPPCTEAIIKAKLTCVVVAALDPNPQHAGRAYKILRAAGIEVVTGVLEDEAMALNQSFNYWIATGKPWVIAKAALSVDAKLTRPRGEGRWLTGTEARRDVQKLRSTCDAILIGAGTARADDPQLTVRLIKGKGQIKTKQPWRVIMTRSGKLPKRLQLLSDCQAERTLIYQNKTWAYVLKDLGKKGVMRLMVEGGGSIFKDLVKKKIIHEVVLYIAPLNYAGHREQPILIEARSLMQSALKQTTIKQLGLDLKLQGLVDSFPFSK